MKAILFAALIVSFAYAAGNTVQPSIAGDGLSLAQIQKLEALRQTKWGNIFITLAEMQAAAGPVDRLIQALDDLSTELGKTLSDENNRYAEKQAAHEALIADLNRQSNEAQNEINNNKQKINAVLQPRIQSAEDQIARDEDLINQKKSDIAAATETRAKQNEEYNTHVREHNDAIAAVDECIQLVQGLISGNPSLLEVKKVSMTIKKLENKLRAVHFLEAPMIQAMIALSASQNYADKDSVNRLLTLLQDFRAKLAQSLNQEHEDEAAAVAAFQNLIAQLNTEINQLTQEIQEKTAEIQETKKEIEQCNDIIAEKTTELIDLKARIDAENENWRKETEYHEEIVAEISRELDVIHQCRELFANKQFSGYVTKKIGK